MFSDTPPPHIERWREGAEGEKATARSLRGLLREGWSVVHDVDIGRGNIDHVLVGPPGIFLLDSKNLRGTLSVSGGVLRVRWREDPDDGYENRSLAPRLRVAAIELERALGARGHGSHVQPVVVLWGHFDQRSVLSADVAWIRGNDLLAVIRRRPPVLSATDVQALASAVGDWAASGH